MMKMLLMMMLMIISYIIHNEKFVKERERFHPRHYQMSMIRER